MLSGRIEIQKIDNGLLIRFTQLLNGEEEYKIVFCKNKSELLILLEELELEWNTTN